MRLLIMLALTLLLVAPVSAQPTGPALSIDVNIGRRPISPDIYGINFADESFAREIDLPVRRWGGNHTSRYNWKNDISNKASDYFFQNIKESDAVNLPADSAVNRFIAQNKRTGTQTLLTVPMIGWTPNNTIKACGFAISKYGPQSAEEQWTPDCGSGLRPDGSRITGNDPRDTSIAISPAFVAEWVTALKARFGPADNGGVSLYALDNEADLWHDTHRDVFPVGVTYAEYLSRTIVTAQAIKSVDPAARTLGPVSWGWVGYWHSPYDVSLGGSFWDVRADRRANGDQPFVAWYLAQLRAHEQRTGQRLLDYFDLHFYPQAANVFAKNAGDAATQALRLRSTRGLWDPTYAEESWINGTEGGPTVRLIPRMRAWVDAHYPGTRLAITEYNWGGLDALNGALAQAEILGIFGREGLDLATLWDPPAPGAPGSFAFRMYRNYDGRGGKFGETLVQAGSADPSQVSIFAAQRPDSALTVMLINKTDAAQTVRAPLGRPASGYRYSGANLSAIQSLGGVNADALTLPAQSITLLVTDVTPLPTPFGAEPKVWLPILRRP
jgi:Glycoside hydrolase family 44